MRSVRSIVLRLHPSQFLIALDARAASGDDAELARSARLETILRVALERNPDLAENQARARAAEARSQAASRLPDLEAKYEQWGVPLARPYALDEANTLMLGVRQTFPAWGTLDARGRAAAEDAGSAQDAARARRQEVAAQVRRAYATYYGADQELRLHLEHVGLTSRVLELARLNQRTGHGSLQDVLRLELELTRLHTDVARIERQQRSSRALLNALMDRPSDAPLGPPEDLSVTPTTDITGLASSIDTNRPEMVAAAPRRAPQRGAARRRAPRRALPDRHGRPRLLVHADVPRLPARLRRDGRHQPAVAVGAPSRRGAGSGADGPGRAARARVHEEHRSLRAARRGRAGRFGPPVVHDHRPGPAGPGEAEPRGDAGRVRRRPGRRGRRCSTRSGPTCRCGSSACGAGGAGVQPGRSRTRRGNAGRGRRRR